MKYNVKITELDIFKQVNLSEYEDIGEILYLDRYNDRVDILCIGLNYLIDDDYIKDYPNLKYILSPTTGIDHIQITRNDVSIINLKPNEIMSVSATAEHTMALMLALIRKIPQVRYLIGDSRASYRGTELKGKTLGIFGLGRIGSLVKGYCEAFGMNVLHYDIGSSKETKQKILSECDIVTIHLPLNKATTDFIGVNEVTIMGSGKRPYLINTSRPQIINKDALLYGLKYKMVSGVALDFINYDYTNVTDVDFIKFIPYNLVLTPHIGGNTYESIEITSKAVVDKFVKLLEIQRRILKGV